jgi:predicted nucleotidyltransferase
MSGGRRQEGANYFTLLQYEHFKAAAEYVAAVLSREPTVKRVALFGSVAAGPRTDVGASHRTIHEPKDVDLAVWIDRTTELAHLRLSRSRAVNRLWEEREIGVARHQVDVFLIDAVTGSYLGRLCGFNKCPKHKLECRVENCGKIPFLRQHRDFVFDPRALDADRIQVLYDRDSDSGNAEAVRL